MSSSPPKLLVEGLSKAYTGSQGQILALRDVDLHLDDGEFVSVIGPSGCGKTTLLNLISGLDQPSSGNIALDGQSTRPRLGTIAYMPQKDMLMPWRSILRNTVLGLEVQGIGREAARESALKLFPLFGLAGFENAYPSELSGGMRQRAALLRTFLADREINLLDEPFGKLDSLTRMQLQQWLRDYCHRNGKTILMITHDIEEAIFLSDRIYVMTHRPGTLSFSAKVSLPRAREFASSVVDPHFVQLKERLLKELRPADSKAIA